MKPWREGRALGVAALAGALALGGAWLVAGAIARFSGGEPAMAGTAEGQIPITPGLVAQGRDEFAMSCSQCHGDDAHGDEGPDLHNLAISNARISATVTKGIKGQMPSFGTKYRDREVAALVAYLRTLH